MKKRNAMIMGCLALVLYLILNAAPGSARAESRYAGLIRHGTLLSRKGVVMTAQLS